MHYLNPSTHLDDKCETFISALFLVKILRNVIWYEIAKLLYLRTILSYIFSMHFMKATALLYILFKGILLIASFDGAVLRQILKYLIEIIRVKMANLSRDLYVLK